MSRIEKYQSSIMQIARRDIKNNIGKNFRIKSVLPCIMSIPYLEEELLQCYEREVLPEGMRFEESGVTREVALMQSLLNDSVLISEKGRLYTNCAPEMLSNISEKYVVNKELTYKFNLAGRCRGYRIVPHRDGELQFVRCKNTFMDREYWLYSYFRSSLEYMLVWCKTGGLETNKGILSFNSDFRDRFGVMVSDWDEYHEPLESYDSLFNGGYVLKDMFSGRVKGYLSDGSKVDIGVGSFVDLKILTEDEAACAYGGGYLNPYESCLAYKISKNFNIANMDITYSKDLAMLKKINKSIAKFLKEKDHWSESKWFEIYPKDAEDLYNYICVGKVLIKYKYGNTECWGLYSKVHGTYKKCFSKQQEHLEKCKKNFEAGTFSEEVKDCFTAEEMGGFGFEGLTDIINTKGARNIPNIFRGTCVDGYDLLENNFDDCYHEYIDIRDIEEVYVEC